MPPDDFTDRTLAELIEEPTGAEHLRYAADGDDSSHRAIMIDQLDPVLNMTESERRRRWLDLDPEIRKILRQLHVQFGHPTNTTLQRILRRQGARVAAIKGVDYLACAQPSPKCQPPAQLAPPQLSPSPSPIGETALSISTNMFQGRFPLSKA